MWLWYELLVSNSVEHCWHRILYFSGHRCCCSCLNARNNFLQFAQRCVVSLSWRPICSLLSKTDCWRPVCCFWLWTRAWEMKSSGVLNNWEHASCEHRKIGSRWWTRIQTLFTATEYYQQTVKTGSFNLYQNTGIVDSIRFSMLDIFGKFKWSPL